MAEQDFLTAEDILNSDDLTIHTVHVPEWRKKGSKEPGKLGLRVMTAEEVIKFQDLLKSENLKKSSWVRLLGLCACDAKGNRLFSDEQMESLKKKNSAVFFRAQKLLLQINGMTRPDKSWEALRKILSDAGIEDSIIAVVQAKWETPDDLLKNDSSEGQTDASPIN